MIKIDNENIEQIANEFTTLLWRKISKNSLQKSKFRNETSLLKQIQEIYLTNPERLKERNESFDDFIQSSDYEKDEIIKMFFDYDKIINWQVQGKSIGYWLAHKLNVNTCPYCNRQYTFTISNKKDKKNIRPQFDHFYPKSTYKYLSLSFYNLIPCCPTCNHVKRNNEVEINPYNNSFGDECRFKITNFIEHNIFNAEPQISFTSEIDNIHTFALKELYSKHRDYISEIVWKANRYNEDYYDSLEKAFSSFKLSKTEMQLLIFGQYMETSKQKDRPLSKLTNDILEQCLIKKEMKNKPSW